MTALMQLEDYTVSEIFFKVNESLFGGAAPESSDHNDEYDFERNILCNDIKDKFIVRLLICCNNREEKFDANQFKFRLELRGIFSFTDEIDEKQKDQLVSLNGISILYGIARGIVSQATANMPIGRLVLPTVNFSEHFKPQG